MKIIIHTDKGVTTEYYSETINSVLEKLQGKEGKLFLNLYHDGIFIKSALIGDLKDNINLEDYYRAYDEIVS